MALFGQALSDLFANVFSNEKTEEQILRAPIDGTVQQLAIHTVGGVVSPAQQLMMIVPRGSSIAVEAR